jgi:hypothetical protein
VTGWANASNICIKHFDASETAQAVSERQSVTTITRYVKRNVAKEFFVAAHCATRITSDTAETATTEKRSYLKTAALAVGLTRFGKFVDAANEKLMSIMLQVTCQIS